MTKDKFYILLQGRSHVLEVWNYKPKEHQLHHEIRQHLRRSGGQNGKFFLYCADYLRGYDTGIGVVKEIFSDGSE